MILTILFGAFLDRPGGSAAATIESTLVSISALQNERSYARKDGVALAQRLRSDLAKQGFDA